MKRFILFLSLLIIILISNINTESDKENNNNNNDSIKPVIYDLTMDEKDRILSCFELTLNKLKEKQVKFK
jgi:hypothetical protein